jgi:HD-GYP domain-containing protein (c-di-GMP phosphodiesterase class II)
MNLIKIHCDIGQSLLKHIDFPWPVHNIIHQHHERLDGSGYPAGLVGDEIHLASRIVGVADVVEAITAHRPYRPALGIEVALEELTSGRGSRYDADVVDACHQVLGAGDEAFQESA